MQATADDAFLESLRSQGRSNVGGSINVIRMVLQGRLLGNDNYFHLAKHCRIFCIGRLRYCERSPLHC
jgi:hypothetical protein